MPKGNVLVASGAVFMRVMLRQILGSLNLDVAVAGDAKETSACLESMVPDIAIIDLAGGDIREIEITRAVKNRNHSSAVIALIPAQQEKPEVIVEMVRAGMDGYIKTPTSPDQVKAYIERWLRKS